MEVQRVEEVTLWTEVNKHKCKRQSSYLTKFTYKFFWAGEVKELDEAEVVSSHQVEAGVRNTSTVNVGFLSISRPNTQNLVAQDAGNTKPNVSQNSTLLQIHSFNVT